MLESLRVKNLALIDETEIFFTKGLNILTGETGAGKSLIIGSIQLALGGKSDKGMIRNGAEYALVELTFSVTEEQGRRLGEFDIYPEDGMISLQRRIMPAKSVCRINGELIGKQSLKEAAGILLDMHGQHDNQSLLKKQKHLEILDEYCGQELLGLFPKMKESYDRLSELRRSLKEAEGLEKDRDKETALAQFECQEIEEAKLVPGEDEKLEQDYLRMNYARKIGEAVATAQAGLGSLDGENAVTMIDYALRELYRAQEYDGLLADKTDKLQTARELVAEVSRSLADYMDGMEFSEAEYVGTETRLNLVNRLKDKYGRTIPDVLAYQERQQELLQKLSDIAVYRESVAEKMQEEQALLLKYAKKVSEIRKKAAAILQKKMEQALMELNFLDVQFEIRVTADEARVSENGYDDVEFLISLNPGEERKPLADIASGGELSRIMLALKTVLADQDEVETLVFDEIDAGISGKTAWKVSEKLAVLGKEHQVICITHLPQIAAMADTHFLIQKNVENERTTTNLSRLSGEEMIEELARLLGSGMATDAVINNAKELKKMADETKQY